MKIYYNIVINAQNNTFYVQEQKGKGKLDALSTLEKIRHIQQNSMKYEVPPEAPNAMQANIFEEGILEPLKTIAEIICTNYKKKIDSRGWRKKFFKSDRLKKNIDIVFNSIFQPSRFQTQDKKLIPAPIMQDIFSHLPLSTVIHFAPLGRKGKELVDLELLKRAQGFGFAGDDIEEGRVYLKKLYIEIKGLKNCIREYMISENCSLSEYNELNSFLKEFENGEKGLKKLQQLTPKKLLRIVFLIDKGRFPGLIQFFSSPQYLKNQAEARRNDPLGEPNWVKALNNAISWKNPALVHLLLENGADPTGQDNLITNALQKINQHPSTETSEINNLMIKRREQIQKVDALVLAIENKDIGKVEELLKAGADPNGKGALHRAIASQSTEMIKLLLNYGADINKPLPVSIGNLSPGFTPLAIACRHSNQTPPNLAIVSLLLRNDADPNVGGPNQRYPLLHAVQSGSVDIIKCLLEHGAKIDISKQQMTALDVACGYASGSNYHPNIEVVKLLIANGLAIKDHPQLLFHACKARNDTKFIQFLLDNGAELNGVDQNGHSPLHYSALHAQEGHLEVYELLLKKGATTRYYYTDEARKIFAHACGAQNTKPNAYIVEYWLKKRNFYPWVYLESPFRGYPLHFATKANAPEIIELLLKHGATTECFDDIETTPLNIAIEAKSLPCMEKLLKNKAKVRVKKKDVITPEMFLLLSKYGLKVKNLNKRQKQWLLLWACGYENYPPKPEIVKILLKDKINLNFKTQNGVNPFNLVDKSTNPELIQLFSEYTEKK